MAYGLGLGFRTQNLFFWLGLWLGRINVCDVTLVCVHEHNVILIRELDQLAARIRSRLLWWLVFLDFDMIGCVLTRDHVLD